MLISVTVRPKAIPELETALTNSSDSKHVSHAQLISLEHYCRSQTNECGIWPGNETLCVHAYKIRKWRPSQQTATTECCEWLLLTRVNLKL